MEGYKMNINVKFTQETPENIIVKTSKYRLYVKMANFVKEFEKLFDYYTVNITPEIVKNAPDEWEELEGIMKAEEEIQDAFWDLENKINDICFETVERAYN